VTHPTSQRRTEREQGLSLARAWRARTHPVAATGRYPFTHHRTCADWAADDALLSDPFHARRNAL
jgi:hypothetical protein